MPCGRYESEFRLQQEREEKLRLLQTISNLNAEVNGLSERIAALVDGASEGLRTTFVKEVEHARCWLGQMRLPDIRSLEMDTDLVTLQTTRAELEQAAGQSQQIQQKLTVAFTQKADAMGQRLAQRLADAERAYISRQQLLGHWFGEQTQQIERTLQEAWHLHGEEQYRVLGDRLETFEREVAEQARWAEEQEDKHQKRLYLLKALRQVCAELGFEEVEQPHYEREGERGSPILFTVDTLDKGHIAFALSLENIKCFSEIAEDHGFTEIEQLSGYLEEFGIQTHFHHVGEDHHPRLIHKGELDVPEGAGMQQEA